MQKMSEQTNAMLLSTEAELFNKIIGTDHPFRKLNEIINFEELTMPLRELYSDMGQTGVDVQKGLKALLIQFWEDYSDRQMEKAIKENLAVRWFCGFSLTEDTPDHTYFCKLRKRIGTKHLADTFSSINARLKSLGLFGNVFTFIDASAIISKTALWEERDQAIADGEKTLNNANVSEYAADKDARWGAKGGNDIWYGYKRHHAVDMRHGLIAKLTVTPANVLDFEVLEQICPSQGMVFMDKLYDCARANRILKAHLCASGTIRKNNNPQKNRDLDRWRSHRRMPFEGTFSKLNDRARFRGKVKVLFQCFAQAMVHNLKKAVTILPMQLAPYGAQG